MRLVEVKILYKADSTMIENVYKLYIEPMLQHPDVIHISRIIIEDGDDEG